MDKKIKKDKFKLQNLISNKIKEALKEYLENLEFEMGYINSNIVFQVKDVEVRKDILKRLGIPLDLVKGRVQEIKITIQSLRFTKPVLIEINGVHLDVSTIYLSRDYKKDYRNSRQKYLDEWEKSHKEFLTNLMNKDTLLDSFINYLIPMKIEINNVKIQILDTVTSKNKKITLTISKITSHAIDENSNTIVQVKEKQDILRRKIKVRHAYVSIFKGTQVDDEEDEDFLLSKSFIDPIDICFKVEIPLKPNSLTLGVKPKLKIEATVDTPIVFNTSVSKLKFLIDFSSYLSKIKGVEKYLIHRPDIRDEKIDETKAKSWFNYAFRVIRQEVRNRKKKHEDLASLVEKTNVMEKYVDLYKTSHKLIIAPWIRYNSCAEDLQAYESKLPVEDIIFCREIAFTELITEGKAFCSSGEIGNGYKPLIHLWEFYVNDLRSKWINKSDQPEQIELSKNEKRDLMMLNSLDKDKVILSYLKGEPNHPHDIMRNIKVCFDVVVFNFFRKARIIKNDSLAASNTSSEFNEQIKFYKEKYLLAINDKIKNMYFIRYFNDISKDEIESIVKQESEDLNESNSEENNYKEAITDDKELEENFTEENYLERDRLLEQNSNFNSIKYSVRNNNQNVVHSAHSASERNERESSSAIQNKDNKSVNIKKNNFSQKLEKSVNYLDDSDIVEMDLHNILHENNTNNINNLNNITNANIKDNVSQHASVNKISGDVRKIASQIGTKSRVSFSNPNSNNLRQSEIPQYHYNHIPKADTIITDPKMHIGKNLWSSNQRNLNNRPAKLRKNLFSIVFGNFNVEHISLRNLKSDSQVKIGSLNFIDHNLTYVGINKYNRKIFPSNSDDKNKSELDYVAHIFKNNFEEKSDNSNYYDNNADENFIIQFYLSHYMAEFLIGIFNSESIRDIVLKELEPEKHLIEDYISRFSLKEINSTIEYETIVEFYQKSVVKFYYERKFLEQKEPIIQDAISKVNTKNRKLLNDRKIIYNHELLFRVFEKGVKKKFSRSHAKTSKFFLDKYLLDEKSRSTWRKSSNNMTLMRQKEDEEIKSQMMADLNGLISEVCVNLIKYVLSSSYMYLMNDKNVQSLYKKNLKNFCEKIKYKNLIASKQGGINKHNSNGDLRFEKDSERQSDMPEVVENNVVEQGDNFIRNSEYNTNAKLIKQGKLVDIWNNNLDEARIKSEEDRTNAHNYFLVLSMKKEGKDYPHYIFKEFIQKDNEDHDFAESLQEEELRSKIAKEEPNRTILEIEDIVKNIKKHLKKKVVKLKVHKEMYLKLSNELIGEFQCLLPYIKQSKNERFSFSKNILSDLKKSYLDIFENFKLIKAKWKMIEYLTKMAEEKKLNDKRNLNSEIKNSKEENYITSVLSKADSSNEMYYLIGALEHIENEMSSKFAFEIDISKIKINLIDKLYFITYEDYSKLTMTIDKISIFNMKMDSLPIYSVDNLKSEEKTNNVKNLKNFDFNLILKTFYQIHIEMKKITLSIDEKVPILETEIAIKLIKSVIPHIPYLPSKIIDIYTPFLKIHVVPKIMKVSFLLKNIKYYNDLYEKRFLIKSEKQIEKEIEANLNKKKENLNSYPNLCKIISQSHKRFQKSFLKVLKNEEKHKNMISYLANRNDTIFYYSIGKLPGVESRSVDSRSKITGEFGIFMDFKQEESIEGDTGVEYTANQLELMRGSSSKYNRNGDVIEIKKNSIVKRISVQPPYKKNIIENKVESIPLEANFITFSNPNNLNNAFTVDKLNVDDHNTHEAEDINIQHKLTVPPLKFDDSESIDVNEDKSSYKSSNKNKEHILTLHIPILMFNKRTTLFYEEKQLWLSDVMTHSGSGDKKKNFENLNIKFDSDSKFNFTSFEFLFCSQFLNAVDYFKNNNEDIHSLEDIEFNSKDFPFDFQFSAPGSLMTFNKLFSQISFFYEEEPKLKKAIYPKLFPKFNKKFLSLPINNLKNLDASVYNEKNILSCFRVSIKKISSKIILKNNGEMYNFYSGIKAYSILEKDFELNKLQIPSKSQDEVKEEISNARDKNYFKSIVEYKITPMLSSHAIRINVKDIKLKVFQNIHNRNENLMAFILIKNISYNENLNEDTAFSNSKTIVNLLSTEKKEDNKKKKMNKNTLSNFFISSVKLVLSIPNYFREDPLENERVKVLDEEKMTKVYDKMKKEENKLIVFVVSNLNMKLIERECIELKIKISDMIKFGFVKREESKVNPNIINLKDIEPIIWIMSNLSKLEENVSAHRNSTHRENLLNFSNKNTYFQFNNKFEREIVEKISGLNLDNSSNHSIKIIFSPNTANNAPNKVFVYESSKLFLNLHYALRVIKSFTSQDGYYTMNLNVNVTVIEIPSYVYNYIFYLRNYLREFDFILNNKKNENTQNASLNYVNNLRRWITKPNCSLSNISAVNSMKISSVPRLEAPEKKNSELKDKLLSLINLALPYLNIRIKQKKEDASEIVFFDLGFTKIDGEVTINKSDRSKNLLQLNAENINLKPYDCRYQDILTRNEDNKNKYLFRLDIKLGPIKKESAIGEFIEGAKAKEKTDEEIRIIGYLNQFDFFLINRFIKEVICFMEQNGECLKENPLISDYALLTTVKFEENIKIKLCLKDGRIIFPESSKSANLICVNFTDGSLILKDTNEIPKLMLHPSEILQIIDKKCTFNTQSIQLTENDLIPHSRFEVNLQNGFAYFYINNQFEEFFKASKFSLHLRGPKNNSKITQLRKIEWAKRFNCSLATYKPSAIVNMEGGKLSTSLVK